jgi:hypothetical protein
MKGFTFMLKGKDVFVETSLVNKTESLASKILTKMLLPDNPDTRKELLYWLQKAECEIKTLSNGKQMYDIHGKNFGGKGSFVDDGKTVIVKL